MHYCFEISLVCKYFLLVHWTLSNRSNNNLFLIKSRESASILWFILMKMINFMLESHRVYKLWSRINGNRTWFQYINADEFMLFDILLTVFYELFHNLKSIRNGIECVVNEFFDEFHCMIQFTETWTRFM